MASNEDSSSEEENLILSEICDPYLSQTYEDLPGTDFSHTNAYEKLKECSCLLAKIDANITSKKTFPTTNGTVIKRKCCAREFSVKNQGKGNKIIFKQLGDLLERNIDFYQEDNKNLKLIKEDTADHLLKNASHHNLAMRNFNKVHIVNKSASQKNLKELCQNIALPYSFIVEKRNIHCWPHPKTIGKVEEFIVQKKENGKLVLCSKNSQL